MLQIPKASGVGCWHERVVTGTWTFGKSLRPEASANHKCLAAWQLQSMTRRVNNVNCRNSFSFIFQGLGSPVKLSRTAELLGGTDCR